MLSGKESGIFGSWLTGSGISDPLVSIQEQSLATILPPTILPCLFTRQPPVVSVRVCVCISQLWYPPNPTPTSLFCPPTAQHAPNPDMARFLIFPFFPPGSERNSITNTAPPSPPFSTTLLSYGHSFQSLCCHLPPCSFPCCWPHHVRSIFPIPFLCVCVCLSRLVGSTTLHHPLADLSNFQHCIVGGSLVSTFFFIVSVYAYWGIFKHVIYFLFTCAEKEMLNMM